MGFTKVPSFRSIDHQVFTIKELNFIVQFEDDRIYSWLNNHRIIHKDNQELLEYVIHELGKL